MSLISYRNVNPVHLAVPQSNAHVDKHFVDTCYHTDYTYFVAYILSIIGTDEKACRSLKLYKIYKIFPIKRDNRCLVNLRNYTCHAAHNNHKLCKTPRKVYKASMNRLNNKSIESDMIKLNDFRLPCF